VDVTVDGPIVASTSRMTSPPGQARHGDRRDPDRDRDGRRIDMTLAVSEALNSTLPAL
jgi:hypothetical protein